MCTKVAQNAAHSLIGPLSPQYEGVPNDDHIPFFMDLNNKGSQLAPYFDIPVPEQFVIPGRRELRYIPGSNKAEIYVYG